MDYFSSFGFWFLVLLAGLLALYFALTHLVAKAARMKNRSYLSFWWLALFFSPLLIGAVVAVLPFNDYDPRNPMSLVDPNLEEQRAYKNNYSMHKLFDTLEKGWLLVGSLAVIVSLLGGWISLNQASNLVTNVDETELTSFCEQELTTADIDAGFIDMGDCLAYRFWTEAERESSGYCSDGYCLDVYVKALSACPVAEVYVELRDENGNVVNNVIDMISSLSTGDIKSLTVSNADNWSDTVVTSLSCLEP